MEFIAGARFGRYEVTNLIGRGGMGEVYRAHDPLLHRDVAVKTERLDRLVAGDPARRALLEARFLREARAYAALRHPSIVTIYDVGFVEGAAFIAMELVDGDGLEVRLRERNVPIAVRIRWLVDIASALGAAHAQGLVHRDIKPRNVMVGKDGNVKVLDFGVVRRAAMHDGAPLSVRTAEGNIVGTPRYMAPEQFSGQAVDGRADQFAWGVVAYEVLCYEHPADVAGLSAGTPAASVTPPPLLSTVVPGLSFDVAAVVARAMSLRPEDRFATMEEAARALEAAAASSPEDTTVSDATTPDRTGAPAPPLRVEARHGGGPLDALETRTGPAPHRRRWVAAVVAVLVVGSAGTLTLWSLTRSVTTPAPPPAPPPTAHHRARADAATNVPRRELEAGVLSLLDDAGITACIRSRSPRGEHCRCPGGPDAACRFECDVKDGEPCGVICGNVAACGGSCGERCHAFCISTKLCDFTCGANCVYSCQNGSACKAVVGQDARVTCFNTATCDIRCNGDCMVTVINSPARVTCAPNADCVVQGCQPTLCPDGVTQVCGDDC